MAQAEGGEAGRAGLFASLKDLLATLLAIGKTRAELLVTEIEEEKFRVLSLCAKAAGAAFFLVLGIILLVCCLAVLFWEQRVIVFGGLAALFLLLGFWLFAALRQQIARPSKLFKASLAELETDMAQLRRPPSSHS